MEFSGHQFINTSSDSRLTRRLYSFYTRSKNRPRQTKNIASIRKASKMTSTLTRKSLSWCAMNYQITRLARWWQTRRWQNALFRLDLLNIVSSSLSLCVYGWLNFYNPFRISSQLLLYIISYKAGLSPVTFFRVSVHSVQQVK